MAKISDRDLLELVHFSRRYVSGRHTYTPNVFNEIYDRLKQDNPEIMKNEYPDSVVETWPYAEVRD